MTPQEFRLKKIMMGITTNEIARRFSVNPSSVNRWQNNYEAPSEIQEWLDEKWETFLQRVAEGVNLVESTGGGAPLLLYRDEVLAQQRQGMSVFEHQHLAAAIYMLCEMSDLPIWLEDLSGVKGKAAGGDKPVWKPGDDA